MKYDELYPKAITGRSYGSPGVTKVYQVNECEVCGDRAKWKDTLLGVIVCSEECHTEWVESLQEALDSTDEEWDDLLGL